jgi:hypothetical protein
VGVESYARLMAARKLVRRSRHNNAARMPSAPAIAGLLQPAILAVAAFILGVASLNDIAVRAIPDVASIGLVLLGVAVRLVDGNAIAALVASAAILLLGAVCWRFGW